MRKNSWDSTERFLSANVAANSVRERRKHVGELAAMWAVCAHGGGRKSARLMPSICHHTGTPLPEITDDSMQTGTKKESPSIYGHTLCIPVCL